MPRKFSRDLSQAIGKNEGTAFGEISCIAKVNYYIIYKLFSDSCLGVETDFKLARKARPAFRVVDLVAVQAIFIKANILVSLDETLPHIRRFHVSDPFALATVLNLFRTVID